MYSTVKPFGTSFGKGTHAHLYIQTCKMIYLSIPKVKYCFSVLMLHGMGLEPFSAASQKILRH